MSTNSSQPWPPSSGLTTIVVPRGHQILSASYRTHISAPAHQVFHAIRETATYPTWNPFVPRVTINTHPRDVAPGSTVLESGTRMTFHVVMDPVKPGKVHDTALAVTDVSTPESPSEYVSEALRRADGTFTADLSTVYRISWREGSGWMSRGLRVERFHEVIMRGDEECEVRTWEFQTSALAYIVKFMFAATIQERFKDWCEGLKTYCEAQSRGTASASTNV